MKKIVKDQSTNVYLQYDEFSVLTSGIKIVMPIWEEVSEDISEEAREDFINKFMKGYNNRPSIRHSNPTSTVPDPIIDHIIKARISKFSKEDIDLIRFGHRLSMAAENILGLILEEYIHNKSIKLGWSCCWGNSIQAVDFCSKEGQLLQIKNRSNTENSSSNKIRNGTKIEKWYRVNATKGTYHWEELNKILNNADLFSEDDFIQFCETLIQKNPSALYVEEKK
jgi:hypothetical protein